MANAWMSISQAIKEKHQGLSASKLTIGYASAAVKTKNKHPEDLGIKHLLA